MAVQPGLPDCGGQPLVETVPQYAHARRFRRGKVQNNEFEIKSPYGALIVKTDMLIGIFPASSEMDDDELETINHDFLSGMVVFDTLDFSTATGHTLALRKADLKGIKLENRAVTREIDTTLFFMVNGDKFSGRLMDGNLTIKTDYDPT